MLIIERRATANHAKYGPILAHMGPLFAEMGLKSGPISAPGGDDWVQNRPQRRLYRRLAPRGRFYASWGANGWRCSHMHTDSKAP